MNDLLRSSTQPATEIVVVGAGYVGLTAAACLAELGHTVRCLEADERRLALLQAGVIPIVEPGLEELVARGRAGGRLTFGDDVGEALGRARFVFLCVGTPPRSDGTPDLSQLADAARQIARAAQSELVLVVKSTVPPGTCEALEILCAADAAPDVRIQTVSNPEFLREGRAVEDFFNPDRVVVGAESPAVAREVADLYRADAPVVLCDRRGSEVVKYAANACLALKISFANEIAGLCERLGTDALPVLRAVGLDPRIGPAFLGPGIGFGGSCLPKDLSGLISVASAAGCDTPLAHAARTVNARAHQALVDKLELILGGLAGARVAVLGLAFKPGTDDVRDSPAVALVRALAARGALVRAHDPLARLADLPAEQVDDPDAAARDAEALVVATAWPQFAGLDPARIRPLVGRPIVLDAVNALDPARWRAAGFSVYGVGRGIPTGFHPVIWQPILWARDGASASSDEADARDISGMMAEPSSVRNGVVKAHGP